MAAHNANSPRTKRETDLLMIEVVRAIAHKLGNRPIAAYWHNLHLDLCRSVDRLERLAAEQSPDTKEVNDDDN